MNQLAYSSFAGGYRESDELVYPKQHWKAMAGYGRLLISKVFYFNASYLSMPVMKNHQMKFCSVTVRELALRGGKRNSICVT